MINQIWKHFVLLKKIFFEYTECFAIYENAN